MGLDELAHLDLYSCFPIAVQMRGRRARHRRLRPSVRHRRSRAGMTFFGGPGNNYVTHSIAPMVDALRADPGVTGLVTGLGWYASTHSWGTYATRRPPTVSGTRQPQDDGRRCRGARANILEAPRTVESYTVTHDRDGEPQRRDRARCSRREAAHVASQSARHHGRRGETYPAADGGTAQRRATFEGTRSSRRML